METAPGYEQIEQVDLSEMTYDEKQIYNDKQSREPVGFRMVTLKCLTDGTLIPLLWDSHWPPRAQAPNVGGQRILKLIRKRDGKRRPLYVAHDPPQLRIYDPVREDFVEAAVMSPALETAVVEHTKRRDERTEAGKTLRKTAEEAERKKREADSAAMETAAMSAFGKFFERLNGAATQPKPEADEPAASAKKK